MVSALCIPYHNVLWVSTVTILVPLNNGNVGSGDEIFIVCCLLPAHALYVKSGFKQPRCSQDRNFTDINYLYIIQRGLKTCSYAVHWQFLPRVRLPFVQHHSEHLLVVFIYVIGGHVF